MADSFEMLTRCCQRSERSVPQQDLSTAQWAQVQGLETGSCSPAICQPSDHGIVGYDPLDIPSEDESLEQALMRLRTS